MALRQAKAAFGCRFKLVFFICRLLSMVPHQLASGNSTVDFQRALTAPNYYVYMDIIVQIDNVSELRALAMEVDIDLTIILNVTFPTTTCEDYLELLPFAFNVNTPNRNDKAYVPANAPIGDKIRENFWFPDMFYREASKVWYPSSAVPTYSSSYENNAPSNDTQSLQFCSPQYIVKRRVTLTCSLEFEDFPLDTQQCTLTISSFTYSDIQIGMNWTTSVEDSLISNSAISLAEYSLVVNPTIYETQTIDNNVIDGVAIRFTFSRNLLYQFLCTILPSFLLVIASCGVYMMPSEMATERTTLSSSALLALFTMYTATRSYVPPSGNLTYADIWMIACLLCVLLVTMECCMVEQFSSSEAEFEERRKRRETDFRSKDDLFRYIQRFKERMPPRIMAERFGPAVMKPDPGFQRPQSEILTSRRGKRLSRGDLDRAIKGLIVYIDNVTPWYQLPWPAKTVDLWAKRAFVGGFILFTAVFWIYIIIVKYHYSI